MGALKSTPAPIEHHDLSEKTGFSLRQIRVLHKRFKQLSEGDDVLRREDFLGISSLKYNPIRKEIIEAFFNRRNFSPSCEGRANEIDFEEFLVVMSHFKPPCSKMTDEQRKNIRREKLKFIFNMHDSDGDGLITLEDYRHVVEELLSRSGALGKETSRAIADAAMFEVARTVGHRDPDEFYEGITFEHFLKVRSQSALCFKKEKKWLIRCLMCGKGSRHMFLK
ncbi:tescalcin b isoform X1 [Poecilia formosa]|uniref:tescalcin b isoform X1 n=1 Tax=Poecilia formosa TaxID=48698 RepID=UPI0004438701|nr:PREDICTED: calcineurin B homologous protein 3-like isoform X1 [Poecilia formosa]